MLVKFNAVRVLGFGDLLIVPGINDLPEDVVADMMEDDIVAAKFDAGELEIIGKEDLGANVKSKDDKGPSALALLLGATEKNAIAAVASTVDLALLEKWRSREKRASVKKALKDQISKIKKIEYRSKDDKPKLDGAKSGASEE